MVGRPAPLSARERGSSPAVGPTSILCTLGPLMLRSVSPLKIGGPGLWGAPQGLPDWVPPSLREPVFWSRRRSSTLSVGHFSPFPSEARCRPLGSRRPVVEVRTEAQGCGRVSACPNRSLKSSHGAWLIWRSERARFSGAPLPGPRKSTEAGPRPSVASWPVCWRGGAASEGLGGALSLGGAPLDRPCWEAAALAGHTQLAAVAGSGLDRRLVVGASQALACSGQRGSPGLRAATEADRGHCMAMEPWGTRGGVRPRPAARSSHRKRTAPPERRQERWVLRKLLVLPALW
ncbi:hypothetical protein NDU88_001716 [Pleurodeles waltl]|uniref:Uncharacterized protein n=1 Tax=Pleurodeles waltl TaxID=8319 RepID=A0AAV7WQ68_PLEWA|nr:hypothetical protein NDU88_001716 [Pleurodeles waltl]